MLLIDGADGRRDVGTGGASAFSKETKSLENQQDCSRQNSTPSTIALLTGGRDILVLCLAAAGAFAGAALGTTATEAVLAAAAFAAFTAAQRLFVAATIALPAAALSFRFTCAVGSAVPSGFESCSTEGRTAFRPEPGAFSVVIGP